MSKLFNRVRMTVSGTPGTGTITLGAAFSNAYCTFAEAGVSTGNVVAYFIEDSSDFEIGIGTYTSAGTLLSRDSVVLSKIGGAAGTTKLTLTSSAIVYLSPRKEDLLSISETQTANRVFAGPSSGGDAAPTFRALVAADLPAGGTGKAADQQIFTSSGTWTKPSGFGAKAYVLIEAWGAGGGGSRDSASNQDGGGGGAYKRRLILLSSLGATETVTIGARGVGRTGSDGAGTSGGSTTVGSLLTAYGGAGGPDGDAGGSGGGYYSVGGNGVSDGDCFTGGHGASSSISVGRGVNGGGGGGGPTNTTGGVSQFGGSGASAVAGVPSAASSPGGGGAASTSSSTNGGDGGDGKCVVTVFDGA
jgi:hypothetical protein